MKELTGAIGEKAGGKIWQLPRELHVKPFCSVVKGSCRDNHGFWKGARTIRSGKWEFGMIFFRVDFAQVTRRAVAFFTFAAFIGTRYSSAKRASVSNNRVSLRRYYN